MSCEHSLPREISHNSRGFAAIPSEWKSQAALEIAVASHLFVILEVDVCSRPWSRTCQARECAVIVAKVFAHLRVGQGLGFPFIALDDWHGHLSGKRGSSILGSRMNP